MDNNYLLLQKASFFEYVFILSKKTSWKTIVSKKHKTYVRFSFEFISFLTETQKLLIICLRINFMARIV